MGKQIEPDKWNNDPHNPTRILSYQGREVIRVAAKKKAKKKAAKKKK